MSHMNLATAAVFHYDTLEEAWPRVNPGHEPMGSAILFQIQRVASRTAGGIILAEQAKQSEASHMQAARVVAIGPLAFRHPDTLAPWPEGAWVKVGDYLRVPKYGGFRFSVKWLHPKEKEPEEIAFVCFEPQQGCILRITGDPLLTTTYI